MSGQLGGRFIVDDESLIIFMLEDALHMGGFKTAMAVSGEKAVELIDGSEGKFCALVTDINLGQGRLRGWDVARRARSVRPEISVVYLTGDSADEWLSQRVQNSVLLTKPFTSDQVLAAVEQSMKGSSHRSS